MWENLQRVGWKQSVFGNRSVSGLTGNLTSAQVTTQGLGRITFTSRPPTDVHDVYVMNADGTELTRITNNRRHNYFPAWKGRARLKLVGVDGKLGTSAGGFLYGQAGLDPRNFLIFDATTRASLRLTKLTTESGSSNLVFNLTADSLTGLAYVFASVGAVSQSIVRVIGGSGVKVLLDTCIWGGVRTTLEEAGHDVEWVGE
jgi:hypothetical protein